jgi:hypothetical protein
MEGNKNYILLFKTLYKQMSSETNEPPKEKSDIEKNIDELYEEYFDGPPYQIVKTDPFSLLFGDEVSGYQYRAKLKKPLTDRIKKEIEEFDKLVEEFPEETRNKLSVFRNRINDEKNKKRLIKVFLFIFLFILSIAVFLVQFFAFIYVMFCIISLPWIISIEIKEPETNIAYRIFRVFYRYFIGPYYIFKHKKLFGTYKPFNYE